LGFDASCTIVVSVVGIIAGSYINTIEQGSLKSNEGATNHDSTSDTLVVTGGSSNGGGGNSGGGGGSDNPGQTVSGFVIPVTGFAPDIVTPLTGMLHPRYGPTALQIEIPVIGVDTSIVGVQIQDGGWNISWLQDQVGWLNGTAYPTRTGNSVLTAHAVDADGKPGTFAKLKYLGKGEFIYLYDAGYRYTYQVISNQAARPDDSTVLAHLEKPYLTLITCDQYDVKSNSYLQRVAVRAKLVDVRAQP
jgi:LPXTG-site transpeptidase (sortase) family protein